MRDDHLWWTKPFVGSAVAIVGLFALGFLLYVRLGSAEVNVEPGPGAPYVPFPRDLAPDLDIAPGAPGYLPSLGLAGHQLHYEDKAAGRTWIAAECWMDGEPRRFAVAGYDGPPTRDVSPDAVRPVESLLLATLVVRVADAGEVWCVDDTQRTPRAPNRVDAGEINLLALPGKVTLWTDQGPRRQIDVATRETVWCTLDRSGLTVERRR